MNDTVNDKDPLLVVLLIYIIRQGRVSCYKLASWIHSSLSAHVVVAFIVQLAHVTSGLLT